MYVCVCNAVTDREIKGAVKLGVRSMSDLSSMLGVATCCGKCARDVRSQLQQACGNAGGCACAARN